MHVDACTGILQLRDKVLIRPTDGHRNVHAGLLHEIDHLFIAVRRLIQRINDLRESIDLIQLLQHWPIVDLGDNPVQQGRITLLRGVDQHFKLIHYGFRA
ncbi:hypothetical protein D3C76_1500690 [compost metagenome]